MAEDLTHVVVGDTRDHGDGTTWMVAHHPTIGAAEAHARRAQEHDATLRRLDMTEALLLPTERLASPWDRAYAENVAELGWPEVTYYCETVPPGDAYPGSAAP